MGMEIQHVRIKVPIEPAGELDLEGFIRVFHRWIQDSVCDELLIDVADYRHVHHGPAVLLIAREADYGIDSTGGVTGLYYTRKDVPELPAGTKSAGEARVTQALEAVLAACDRIEKEERFGGRLRFDRDRLEITINDRLLAPNTSESFTALEAVVRSALEKSKAWANGRPFAVEHASSSEPRELLSARVTRRRS